MYKKILPTAMAAENTPDKAALGGAMAGTLPQNIVAATLKVSIQKPVEVIVSSPPGEDRPQTPPEAKPEAAPPVQARPEAQAETAPPLTE